MEKALQKKDPLDIGMKPPGFYRLFNHWMQSLLLDTVKNYYFQKFNHCRRPNMVIMRERL
jgi:hypothetical protein